MYLHLYNNDLCRKSKNILTDPLKTKLNTNRKKVSHLFKNLFSKEYRLKNIIYNCYSVEQKFMIKNHQYIVSELNKLDIDYFHKHYNSPLITYLLDYISDYYNVSIGGNKTQSIYLEKLISFFYMNELLFYISNGNVILSKAQNTISVSPMNNQHKYLKRRWFAYVWEKESKDANIGLSVLANLTIPKIKLFEAIIKFSDLYMDKIFFMHNDYISSQNKKKEQYTFIYNLCKFFILLHLTKDHKITKDDNVLDTLELNKNNFIHELMIIHAQQVPLDKGFYIQDNMYILNESSDIYNVLKSYLLGKYQQKLSNVSSQFGKIFEDYVKLYCLNNFSNDYQVITDNIDYNKDGINVDIDLTLYDKSRDFYYFVQVKYAISNKPYLSNEIKGICNNKTLKKGLKQLEGFKEALHQELFRELLKNKKINLHGDNFSLILIHTISQFDFHEINNIQLYEWNNFRNLLNKGMQQNMNINLKNTTHDIIQNSKTLALEKIDDVIQISMNNGSRDYDSLWNEFNNSFFKFTLNNQLFKSNIK